MSGYLQKENMGILAMEMYVPTRFVSQEDMEEADGCKGKYTVGLGQESIAFTDDREDVTSIFLTVVHNLLEKYGISPSEVGRLEVGTETLTDKSKSVKTSLIRLFGDHVDMEGVTNVNACYGGTAALFNSFAWLESSEWNGKFALVVCGDIAVYEAGPARPTGGCGAIAMLLGFNAPVVMESGTRSSHVLDVYDFYKPHHSEYAAVDGKLSQFAYLNSVDMCYSRYKEKHAAKHPGSAPVTMSHFDLFAFHSPYNKLVQKGFGRLAYMDARAAGDAGEAAELRAFAALPLHDTYESRELEIALRSVADRPFKERVLPCCRINQRIGNCYTGSVYSSLLSAICEGGTALDGKRVLMFSYGSGSVASLWSFRFRAAAGERFTVEGIQARTGMAERLGARTRCTVAEFTAAMDLRAAKYGQAPMVPGGSIDHIAAGTYYLTGVNDRHHRDYARK
jgi:hydroxymethylglutaryl-CoA synthase